MINFDDYAHENIGIAFKTMKELRSHNLKWSYITDHPCRILKIGGSGSGKTCIIEFNKRPAGYW